MVSTHTFDGMCCNVPNPHILQELTEEPTQFERELVGDMLADSPGQNPQQGFAHEWSDEHIMDAYGEALDAPEQVKHKTGQKPRQAKRRDERGTQKQQKVAAKLPSAKPGETTAELFKRQLAVGYDILEKLAEAECFTTTINLGWTKLLRRMQIPISIGPLYHKWLLGLRNKDGTARFEAAKLPKGENANVAPGMKLPPPYGEDWHAMLCEKDQIYARKYREATSIRLQEAAVCHVLEEIRHKHMHGDDSADEDINDEQAMEYLLAAKEGLDHGQRVQRLQEKQVNAVKKKKEAKENAEGKVAPKTVQEALTTLPEDEMIRWSKSFAKEFDGLNKLGVFEHDLTREDLLKRGVCNAMNPIPMSVVLCFKYDKDGKIDRYKTRMALAGHKGNMQKGVHYDKTYASCPDTHATRMLQAMVVKYGLIRSAFDIEQAYCQASMPENEQVAVRYPQGFTRRNSEGEELFMLLVRNLYGHPSGGRHWEKERNAVLMKEFSTNGYHIKKCVKEPCMFLVRRGEEYAYMLLHTDDADCAGSSQAILEEIQSKIRTHWGIKAVNPDYMLGVHRVLQGEGKDRTVELTMTAFVESMALAFKKYVFDDKKLAKLKTPSEKGMHLHKHLRQDEESQRKQEAEATVVRDRGYAKLLGMILWAARMCFPECLVGASMLGRVMACPTEEAWSEGIKIMNWMIQNKHRGIKFSANGNEVPVVFVDASNKPDPSDGKCQYGYVIMWKGGPIVTVSKKLAHVGLSAAHNEYMAMHWANRKIAWMRDFMLELELPEMVELPTLNCGDNQAALILSEEDIVTTGNQFIQVPYHYNKEMVLSGASEHIYVPTDLNLADVFTKCVTKQVIDTLLQRVLGYEQCPFTIEQLNKQRTKQTKVRFCRSLCSDTGIQQDVEFKSDYGEPELYKMLR